MNPLRPEKIVLISRNPEDSGFTGLLATNCNRTWIHKTDFAGDEIFRSLNQGDTVIVDAAIPHCMEDVFLESLEMKVRNRIHYICDPEDLSILKTIFQSKVIHNVIYRKYHSLEEAAKTYARIINISYVDMPFGLKQYFGEDVHLETTRFNESREKSIFTDTLSQQLSERGYNHYTVPVVTNAVDELLMNAMFDAPVDAEGNQIYATTPRSTNISLTGKQSVELQMAGKDDLLGIAVSDCYGSLDSSLVRKHIARSLSTIDDLSTGFQLKRGAGLGLSLIQRSGGSLYFCCKKGEKTEVTVFFKRTPKHRDLGKQFQFISIRMME